MNHHPAMIGNIYFELLSLLIIFFASYTMFSMVEQEEPKEGSYLIRWIIGGSLVFSIGLWAMHVVSLLGSDYLIVLGEPMLYALFGSVCCTSLGIILLKKKWSLHLQLSMSSLLISIGALWLHYLMMLSGTIVTSELNIYLLSLSSVISLAGNYLALYWFVIKARHYKLASSVIVAVSSITVHLIGMRAMVVEYTEVLTTDRLNDYMMLLVFLLGIAILLIVSFMLKTWLATRKYGIMDARYKLLVENSLDTIALIKDNKWEYINPSGYRLFDADQPNDLVGKSIYQFLHEKDHDEVRDWLYMESTCLYEQQKTKEFQWKTVKGKWFCTEMLRTTTSFSGQLIDQVIIRDISERKKNEELLINSEKLYIAGQLAAGIAHEIRNPLTSLKGFLQLIASGRSNNKNYYDIMNSELVRIEMIVSEMLMLSKPQIYELSNRDVRKTMAETVMLLDTEANLHNIEIELEIGPDPLWINGVENQIKQVFINVIKNAIEAMPSGGSIKINMSLEDNKTIIIKIQDEGPGMKEEQLSKVGQPFYTTKEKGTGLGLMVTYKIVDNHQGSIFACSESGNGTTFIIQFPYIRIESTRSTDN